MNCKKRDVECIIVGYAGVDRIIRITGNAEKGKTSLVLNRDNRNVTCGGNGSNVSICMAKLGCHVLPVMRVGADWETLGYRQVLEESGVCLDGVTVVENETTSICHLIEDESGNHLTLTYPGAMDEKYVPDAWDESLFQRARYGLVTVATRQDIERFLELSEKHRLPLVFGVRVDLESFPLPVFERLLFSAEVIFMNEVEREFVEREIASLQDIGQRGQAKHIVVTKGSLGSDVYIVTPSGMERIHANAAACRGVVDATGAGDSYIAGYMYSYLKGCGAEECAVTASCEASFIIEKVGCTAGAPTEAQLLEKVKTYYQGG